MPKKKKNIKIRDQKAKQDPKGGRISRRVQGGGATDSRAGRRPLQ